VSSISNAISIAASGMNAADALLNATANNIANADTPGYQDEGADLEPLEGGGVGVDTLDLSDVPNTSGGSNINLAQQMTNLSSAQFLYNANAAVISITNQMYGNLIDVIDNASDDDDQDNS
jgi:flagellar basal body rod protein FlgG